MRDRGLSSVQVMWLELDQISGVLGLKAYGSIDGGAHWTELSFPDSVGTDHMPMTVTALAAGKSHDYTFAVAGLNDFKLTYTAALVPTAWTLAVTLHYGPQMLTV